MLSVAKLKIVFAGKRNFSLNKAKKEKKNFFLESLDQCWSTGKGKKCFLWWAYICLTSRCYTTSHLHQVFFDFAWIFLAFFAHTSYFKNNNPFALVGCEIGYSQLGTMRLVGNLPSHIQHALHEELFNIPANQKGVYLFYNPLNNYCSGRMHVDRSCIFCWFFRVSQYGILSTNFLFIRLWLLQKLFFASLWPILKVKLIQLLVSWFYLYQKQTTESDGGYHVVTTIRFCITWSILSNESLQKLFGGL